MASSPITTVGAIGGSVPVTKLCLPNRITFLRIDFNSEVLSASVVRVTSVYLSIVSSALGESSACFSECVQQDSEPNLLFASVRSFCSKLTQCR
jgi:hypothetical protein